MSLLEGGLDRTARLQCKQLIKGFAFGIAFSFNDSTMLFPSDGRFSLKRTAGIVSWAPAANGSQFISMQKL